MVPLPEGALPPKSSPAAPAPLPWKPPVVIAAIAATATVEMTAVSVAMVIAPLVVMAAASASVSSFPPAPAVPRVAPISVPLPPLRLPRRKEEQTNVNA